MSLTTKHALAESFKKLLSKRSFDKITVKDIVEDCGVNRQTFYYHFHDIYDLIEWIFQDAANRVSEDSLDYNNWTSGLGKLTNFLLENKVLILNAYNSINHEVVAEYIRKGLHPYCAAIVHHQAMDMDEVVSQKNIDFVSDVFTLAATGIVAQWIGNRMKVEDDSATIMDKFKTAMSGSIQLMLHNLDQSK